MARLVATQELATETVVIGGGPEDLVADGVAAIEEVAGAIWSIYDLLQDAKPATPKPVSHQKEPVVRTVNAKEVANKTEEGKTTVAPKSKTRREALTKAKNHAQVPGDNVHNGGGRDIPMDEQHSRGKNWEEMKKNGAKRIGREKANSPNMWREDPDGHPDAGQDGIPEHHGGGHVHATSPQGVKIVFPY